MLTARLRSALADADGKLRASTHCVWPSGPAPSSYHPEWPSWSAVNSTAPPASTSTPRADPVAATRPPRHPADRPRHVEPAHRRRHRRPRRSARRARQPRRRPPTTGPRLPARRFISTPPSPGATAPNKTGAPTSRHAARNNATQCRSPPPVRVPSAALMPPRRQPHQIHIRRPDASPLTPGKTSCAASGPDRDASSRGTAKRCSPQSTARSTSGINSTS